MDGWNPIKQWDVSHLSTGAQAPRSLLCLSRTMVLSCSVEESQDFRADKNSGVSMQVAENGGLTMGNPIKIGYGGTPT